MRSIHQLLLTIAAVLVSSADGFAVTSGTADAAVRVRSPTALHATAESRRAFLSAAVLLTSSGVAVPAFAAVIDDLAMPSASEQKQMDEVRTYVLIILCFVTHHGRWHPLDSTLCRPLQQSVCLKKQHEPICNQATQQGNMNDVFAEALFVSKSRFYPNTLDICLSIRLQTHDLIFVCVACLQTYF